MESQLSFNALPDWNDVDDKGLFSPLPRMSALGVSTFLGESYQRLQRLDESSTPRSGGGGGVAEDAYSSGYFLLLPKKLHITVLALLVAFVFAAALPSILLMDYAPNQMSGALVAQGVLIGLMAASCVALSINALRREEGDYIPLLVGLDRVTIAVAIGAVIMLVIAAGNLILGLSKCNGKYGEEATLFHWIYGADASVANSTEPWRDLRRKQQLGTTTLWFQLCLEDLPVAITFTALYAAILVLDLTVITYMLGVRKRTIKTLRE